MNESIIGPAVKRDWVDRFFAGLERIAPIICSVLIMMIIAFVFYAGVGMMERYRQEKSFNLMMANYSTCGNSVIYENNGYPYVVKKDRKVFLLQEGCK